MAYVYYNPNPSSNRQSIGDCVVRAISKIMNYSWDKTYTELCVEGFTLSNSAFLSLRLSVLATRFETCH